MLQEYSAVTRYADVGKYFLAARQATENPRTGRYYTLREVTYHTGINTNMLSQLERGVSLSIKATDLLKLINFYTIDVYEASAVLGVPLWNTPTQKE